MKRRISTRPSGNGVRQYFCRAPCSDGLESDDVLSLKALRALLDFKLHGLPFVEALVPLGLDRREMHEDILTGLALDESVALCRIKPLHCTLFSGHFCCS